MVVDFEYRPLDVHVPFHTSTARHRALAGAMGSGKSYALCAEAIAWCLEQPGIHGLITRKTVPMLRDSTEKVFFSILPPELYMAGKTSRVSNHIAEFIFPNGSKVTFKSIQDWMEFKSWNLGFIAYDEADEFDEELFMGMSFRLRQVDPNPEAIALGYKDPITKNGTWLAFNPNGHDWLYKHFVDPETADDGTDWFRSTSFDNPYLPPATLKEYLAKPDPWVRRYVLCQFDDFAGQIYENWGWDSHVLPRPPQLTGKEIVWMGCDPGMNSPTAGLWVVVDREQRRLIGIAEYQEKGLAAINHAASWRRIEAQNKMKVAWRVADGNYITRRDPGTATRLSDQYRRLGFRFSLGSNDPRITIPSLGSLIEQARFVLSPNCPQTYEAIRDYRWEDLTPQQRAAGIDARERPLKRNTHLVECAQYLSGRYLQPMKPEPEVPEDDFSAEVGRAIKKQLILGKAPIRNSDIGNMLV